MLQGKKASITHGQMVKITKKYGTTAFMYTQYPHKRFWNSPVSNDTIKSALVREFSQPNIPSMLYVHMPYCEQLCWFCTCHIAITKNYSKVNSYVQLLKREIDLLDEFFDKEKIKPLFREIHLGGGSPTFMNEDDFVDLLSSLQKLVDIKTLDEFAIEIDPRRVDRSRMHFYAAHGINRISFGIQDFDINVQNSINRVQGEHLIENLIVPEIRSQFKNGVNFDVLVGLPHQTPATMKATCETIIRLSPDRVCMNYMHYSPEFAKHQTITLDGQDGRPNSLPDFMDRKHIFMSALETLTSGGYVRTGYDHFAKPEDANARALQNGNMFWNELGATPGRVENCIGVGVSSKSTIGDSYLQNYYELDDYETSLANGKFPVLSHYQLKLEDKIRRSVILDLRNYFEVKYHDISKKYDIDFASYFETEIHEMKELEKDGIVEVHSDRISITELGYQFANIVCRVFDKYYQSDKYIADLGERELVQITVKGT